MSWIRMDRPLDHETIVWFNEQCAKGFDVKIVQEKKMEAQETPETNPMDLWKEIEVKLLTLEILLDNEQAEEGDEASRDHLLNLMAKVSCCRRIMG